MSPIKSISIPEPCHQSWQEMTPVENGRHCQSCCKTVVDFNTMSNADVVAYLASHKNACGRIDSTKLAAVNYQLELDHKKPSSWKGMFAVASLSMLFPAITVNAQNKPVTEQAPYTPLKGDAMPVEHIPGNITVSGKVSALADGQPIEGAGIVVKGTTTGTQTSADGRFKLKALKPGDTLVVSFLGYKAAEMPVGSSSQNLEVNLETAVIALNDVCVTGYGITKKQDMLGGAIVTLRKVPFYLRWWYWLLHQLKHVAHAITHL